MTLNKAPIPTYELERFDGYFSFITETELDAYKAAYLYRETNGGLGIAQVRVCGPYFKVWVFNDKVAARTEGFDV